MGVSPSKYVQPLDKIQKQNTMQLHKQKVALQKCISLNTETVQRMLIRGKAGYRKDIKIIINGI